MFSDSYVNLRFYLMGLVFHLYVSCTIFHSYFQILEELWSMSDKLFFGYQQWAKPFGLRFDYHQPLAGVFLNRFFAIFAGKQLCRSLFLKKVTCNISGGCVSIKNSVYNFKIWGKLNKQSLFQLTVNFTVREAMYLVFMKQLN